MYGRFDLATYSVNERKRFVVVDLILSNPSSEAISFDVQSRDITATGMNELLPLVKVSNIVKTQEELIMIQDLTLSHFLQEISGFDYLTQYLMITY